MHREQQHISPSPISQWKYNQKLNKNTQKRQDRTQNTSKAKRRCQFDRSGRVIPHLCERQPVWKVTQTVGSPTTNTAMWIKALNWAWIRRECPYTSPGSFLCFGARVFFRPGPWVYPGEFKSWVKKTHVPLCVRVRCPCLSLCLTTTASRISPSLVVSSLAPLHLLWRKDHQSLLQALRKSEWSLEGKTPWMYNKGKAPSQQHPAHRDAFKNTYGDLMT